ncbi:MAG: hypothetical protein A2087_10640 [Spirochaetes bacterium GWD1_61_31]|nr:MAG: hypothetical protein A2Y37_00170 [Spirochaetes bacterium GWB1_60_80]OHD32137.1 MAG: hypothetical protein A2004_05035 [Spirochaetes bacterium GWC1_61_12]OHD37128.1 MAG: hypothetical protein A2087_10640 [Spirochaetes bacterium GWD1_61_31]OHD42656.1 MAG: hypothetical protein A2Y35_12125 [Spirochaetes bacterium GWE1_60_18]OHD58537.1 MAG: hypothetical protein A2Y32_08705 [Spirochaetes bacterium GWF1_60_12]HAP43959.1 hypothetical protein [Spirochaetaceae bacterium]
MKPSLPHNNSSLIWSAYSLPEGNRPADWQVHNIGDCHIHVGCERSGDQASLFLLTRHDELPRLLPPDCPPPSREPPRSADDRRWQRCAIGKLTEYQLLPVYPTLPLCIHLDRAVSLPPGGILQGWLFSSASAEIRVGDVPLTTVAPRTLHKTLYGNTTDGVVCHDLSSPLLDKATADDPLSGNPPAGPPDSVAHPIRIRNSSGETVVIQELCVYGSQLSIFRKQQQLFSETIQFTFGPTRIKMGVEPLSRRDHTILTLAEAKIGGEEKVLERSLEVLKALTRM